MLNIWLGNNYLFMKDKIGYVSEYFDAMYDENWFRSDMAKHIIWAIDESEYIDGDYIKSPGFGGISPRDLSTGCKALLTLLNEPNEIVSGDRMGDNCFPVLFEMAKKRDYTITLCHIVDFSNIKNFVFRNARTGVIINTPEGFIEEYVREDNLDLKEGE